MSEHKNIKKMRGGRNNVLCVSWYENPKWTEEHKRVERKKASFLLAKR